MQGFLGRHLDWLWGNQIRYDETDVIEGLYPDYISPLFIIAESLGRILRLPKRTFRLPRGTWSGLQNI
jgi:hypothetical protein